MNKAKSFSRRNFTLIEILAVCGIILLLAGMSLGVTKYVFYKQAESKTIALIKMLDISIKDYNSKNGCWPDQADTTNFYYQITSSTTLQQISYDELKNRGFLDSSNYIVDGWKRKMKYVFPGTKNKGGYDIISAGADGTFNNADDITNSN